MSVLVEFAMFPTDKGESVSAYVSRILKMLHTENVPHQLTAMGTIFETETLAEALDILKKAYETLSLDCSRIYATAKFDIRKNTTKRMEGKIKSVERHLTSLSPSSPQRPHPPNK